MLKKFGNGILLWFKLRLVNVIRMIRHRPLAALSMALFAIAISVFFRKAIVQALSSDWVQTNWSDGPNTDLTIDSANLTNWTKYYSATSGIDNSTSGELKLRLESTP